MGGSGEGPASGHRAGEIRARWAEAKAEHAAQRVVRVPTGPAGPVARPLHRTNRCRQSSMSEEAWSLNVAGTSVQWPGSTVKVWPSNPGSE